MNNQSSRSGGRSDKVQAVKKGSASKTVSGKGPAADSLTGTSTPADTAGQSAAPGPIAPDSVKGGHN